MIPADKPDRLYRGPRRGGPRVARGYSLDQLVRQLRWDPEGMAKEYADISQHGEWFPGEKQRWHQAQTMLAEEARRAALPAPSPPAGGVPQTLFDLDPETRYE